MQRNRDRGRDRTGGNGKWYEIGSYKLNGISPNLIHRYGADKYYASNVGEIQFPFSSTRNSPYSTVFDSSGRLVWAPSNLCTYSEDFTQAGWAATNGTKTTGVSSPDGLSNAGRITATSTGAILQITSTVVVGMTYTVSLWARSSVLTGVASIRAVEAVNTPIAVTGEWKRFSFSATATTTTGRIGVHLANNSDQIEIWGAQLELTGLDSPKEYIKTTGSAVYKHRIDYIPDGSAPNGLLAEETRTNICPNYSTVSGVTGGSSAAGNNIFGLQSTRITFDGSSSAHYATYGTIASAPSASTVYTLSLYVRYVSGAGLVQLTAPSNFYGAVTDYVNFDIKTGFVVASGATVVDSFMCPCGNDVYRLSMSFTTGGSPSAGPSCVIAGITSSSDTRLPTNTSTDVFECFGAQLESGRGVTSLIPTFGSSITRPADTFSTTSIGWIDQTKGTWYMEVVPQNGFSSSRRIMGVNDGTANNSYSFIMATNKKFQIRTAVSGTSNFSPTTAESVTGFHVTKVAVLLSSPTKKIVIDSGAVASASVAFPTSGYTTLTVGAEPSNAAWNGWIREIRYYADASASDGQLQALTYTYTVLTSSSVSVPSTFSGLVVENVGCGNGTATAPWDLSVGYGIHRLLGQGTYWPEIETSDNVFDWTKMDAAVNAAYAAGKTILWNVAYTPTFHASNVDAHRSSGQAASGGWASAPSDLAGSLQTYPSLNSSKWGRFLQAAVTRYTGKIKYYVMWNEPNYRRYGISGSQEVPHGNWFDTSDTGVLTDLTTVRTSVTGNQNYTQFVRLQADLYGIVHDIDPSAVVLGPDFFGEASSQATGGKQDGVTCFSAWLSAGGASYCDGYSWHGYMDEGFGLNGVSYRLVGKLNDLETARVVAGAPSKSWYNTETGHEELANLSIADQKKWLGRQMLIFASKGWKAWVMYVWDSANPATTKMSLWGFPGDSSPGLRLIGSEFSRLSNILNGSTITSAVIYSDGTVVATIGGVGYSI